MSGSRTPQESGSFGASFLAFALSKRDERPGGDVTSPVEEESGATNPEQESPDTPRPGSSSGHQGQLSRQETEPKSTPRAAETVQRYEGLPERFPSPPTVPRTTPPTFHRGPATSSSLSGSEGLGIAGPDPDPARTMLDRGPPPGARDPMDIPDETALGRPPVTEASRARIMASGARHAAIVFKRLIDAGSRMHADHLDVEFRRVFGQQYDQAFVEIIQSPPESSAESDENGNGRRGWGGSEDGDDGN